MRFFAAALCGLAGARAATKRPPLKTTERNSKLGIFPQTMCVLSVKRSCWRKQSHSHFASEWRQ